MNAPNEGREELTNQEIGSLWEEYEAVMIQRWPPDEYGEDEDLSSMYSITEQFKTELLLLRDQLSIEKEFRGNLLKDISNLSDQLSKEREAFIDKLRFADKNNDLLRGHRDELQTQLEKEREMRKELVGYVIAYRGLASLTSDEDIFIGSLLKQASELDKN